jgi:PhzF family phenazine biosynthesis protein
MKIRMFQVDAFTSQLFSGNPAAVCPLERWPSEELMQNIALENNLAETAFYVRQDEGFGIRWFTPAVEVDLCGHATLAAAFVIFELEKYDGNAIRFVSPRSGELTVTKNGDLLTLDFPSDAYTKAELTRELLEGFDLKPRETYRGKTDYMLVFDTEDEIRSLQPDFTELAKVPARGVIVTAAGEQCDFVSRFFAPQSGINEDPVTGSAHTTLIPYWYARTGKQTLHARQLSSRGGTLTCTYKNERVLISGNARLYLRGEIEIDL